MNQKEFDEYIAASDYPHPPKKIGRVTGPDQITQFKTFFGKAADLYLPDLFYAGKSDDGLHVFTHVDSWIKYRQRKTK